MAEQEACASAVTEALAAAGEEGDNSGGAESRGESLLLPLLQGLLGGGGRLLAGLGGAPDVLADVRRALARLRAALAPPAAHPSAAALLHLADRLEDALAAPDRLDGCRRRARRRPRTSRHTVAVTSDDLRTARLLMDEPAPPAPPERRESIDDEIRFHDAPRNRPSVEQSENSDRPILNGGSVEVVERRAPAPRKPDFYRHSIGDALGQSHTQQVQQVVQKVQRPAPPAPPRMDRRPSDTRSSIAAIANKFDAQVHIDREQGRRAPVEHPPMQKQNSKEDQKRTPLYRPLPPSYNFAAPPTTADDSKPLSRFGNGSKRLRMKRANTIDIGRSLASYRPDSDTDEEGRRPLVPPLQPQTENDRKFVAFMKKNEAPEREPVPHNNWSSRFGNIKNTFESRDQQEGSRSSSASSARRFWRSADEQAAVPRARGLPSPQADAVKPPWVTDRREPVRAVFRQPPPPAPAPSFNRSPYQPHQQHALHPTTQFTNHLPQQAPQQPSYQPPSKPIHEPPRHLPLNPSSHSSPQPQIPQSPTKPLVVKPFAAKPIPVNQFSHAPMSAFKPLTKIPSPTTAPAHIWSPPSLSTGVSPTTEMPPYTPIRTGPSPPTSWISDTDRVKAVPSYHDKPPTLGPPTPPTHAPPPAPYSPARAIPTHNNLAAPELVKRATDAKQYTDDSYSPKLDAEQLQIQFYEKQIREKNRREATLNGYPEFTERKPPAPAAYTVTDYTPLAPAPTPAPAPAATFMPLQRTPDIEKARAHKVDYLPDVVSGAGEGAGDATEHTSVTRVMRGPVRGAATITAGARTRRGHEAAGLRGVLGRLAPPQVGGRSPQPSPAPPASPGTPGSPGTPSSASPLSRSGSWHQVAGSPKASSPRRVVARTKSMHLLALPKMFEGGIAREEVTEKQRTVEAYFASQAAPPAPAPPTKPRAPLGAYSLGRSRTMPAVSELQFLDESNADDAFEDLVSALA